MSNFIKDPDATLDYTYDWSAWLGTDTIITSIWQVPAGLTQPYPDESTDTTATIWLAGGNVGESYPVLNRITTAEGRIDDRTMNIVIEQK